MLVGFPSRPLFGWLLPSLDRPWFGSLVPSPFSSGGMGGEGEVVPGVCWISLPLRSSLRLVPEDYQFGSGLCAFTNLKFRLLYRDVGGGGKS